MATKAPDYASVVLKLREKTQAGKVEWRDWGSSFRADLGDEFVFDIAKFAGRGDTTYSLVMRDREEKEVFSVTLTDDPDTMLAQEKENLYSALGEIYELARRKALKVDEKVEKVTEILEKI